MCLGEGPGTLPIALDNQVYYYIAERITAGVPPHISQFDTKNALSGMITAAAMILGRAFGVDDVVAARTASIVAVVAAVVLAWVTARRLFGGRTAASVAAASPLGFFLFYHLAAMGARPKVFLVPFIFAAFLAVDARRWVLAGVCGAACFLVWQPALIVTATVVLAAVLSTGRRRDLPRALLGTIVPVLLYEAYFLAHGALEAQLWQAFVFPPMYGKPMLAPIDVLARIFESKGAFPQARVAMAPLVPVFVGVWGAVLLQPRRCLRRLVDRPVIAAVIVYAHAALVFSVIDYQGRPDRLFLVPAASLAGAAVVAALLRLASRVAGRFAGGVVGEIGEVGEVGEVGAVGTVGTVGEVVGGPGGGGASPRVAAVAGGIAGTVFAVALAASLSPPDPRPFYRADLDDQRALAARVGQWLEAGESVWAIGCTHLLALNHVTNVSSYGYFPYRVRLHLAALARRSGGMFPVADEEGDLPDVIVHSRFHLPVVDRWIAANYRRAGEAPFERDGIRVYRRKEPAKPRPSAGERAARFTNPAKAGP